MAGRRPSGACVRLDQHDPAVDARYPRLEVRRRANLGHNRAAALLRGRDRDAAPPLSRRFGAGRVRAHDRPAREERLDGVDAEHRGVAHDGVHPVSLEDRLRERQPDTRFRRRRDPIEEAHPRAAPAGAFDPGAPFAAPAVEDRDLVSLAQPQHARQVMRFVRWQLRELAIDRGRVEPWQSRLNHQSTMV